MAILTNAGVQAWATRINMEMRAGTLLDSPVFINRNYESASVNAKEVKAVTYARVKAIDATIDSDIGSGDLSNLSARNITIPLDQRKTVQWYASGLENLQVNTNVGMAAIRNAGRELAEVRELYIAQKMAEAINGAAITAVDTSLTNANIFGVPASPSTNDQNKGFVLTNSAAYVASGNNANNNGAEGFMRAVRDAAVRMDKMGVPTVGRFLLVPPEFRWLVAEKYDRETPLGDRRLESGWIRMLEGFDVIMNNYLYNVLETGETVAGEAVACIAGHPDNFTFADQANVVVDVVPAEKRPMSNSFMVTSQYGGQDLKQYGIRGTTTDTVNLSGNCIIYADVKTGT